ncbi:MAG: DEAD/DEAH box helicase [Lentisphaeria bacterium]|nr:DEAD/DEAH box helicase [Lentisphaeria bacterium]
MSMDTFERNLSLLVGEENLALGRKLCSEGAILDVRKASRGLEVRVANERGTFHTVRISIRQRTVTAQCGCMKQALFCEHSVASLLVIAEEYPEQVSFLKESDFLGESTNRDPGGRSSLSDAVTRSSASQPRLARVAVESLRELLDAESRDIRLSVVCQESLTTMESHWNRITLQVFPTCGGRHYAPGNVRRLMESGMAAGNMRTADFTPQEHQIMQFLSTHSSAGQNDVQLNAHEMCDLMHRMTGFDSFEVAGRPVHIHSTPLTLSLAIRQREGGNEVVPRLSLADRGVLPPGRPVYIAGRGGYWIGLGEEFWWLPALLPQSWLLLFLSGQALALSESEVSALLELRRCHRFPVRIVEGEGIEVQAPRPGICRPFLELDWGRGGIDATLGFFYAGRRCGLDASPLVWDRSHFIRRDPEAETAAAARLKTSGFRRDKRRKDRFRLSSLDDVWQFVHGGVDDLRTAGWRILWSPEFSENRDASGEIRLVVEAGEEGDSWFEAQCELSVGEGEAVPWERLSDALRNGDEFVRLDSGALVRLPGDVLRVIRLLLRRATTTDEGRMRFWHSAAIPLGELLAPYMGGGSADWMALRDRLVDPQQTEAPALSPLLDGCLRPYQREGVRWLRLLEDCSFCGILADEMGLGKTVQALAAVAARKREGLCNLPSIVICPTSLVENWLIECSRFTPELCALAIRGNERTALIEAIPEHDLVVTSYALLRRDIVEYESLVFDYIILDEAQHIKNPRTANAESCKELQGAHRLILTGTPVENSLVEIWSLFDFLLPGYLGTHRDFRHDYEVPVANGQGDRTTKELAAHIHPFILRRTKQEVCKELPDKIEQVLYCELGAEQRHLYTTVLAAGRQMLQQAKKEGWGKRRFELLSILVRLRQICCHPVLLPDELLEGFPSSVPSAKTELAREVILEAVDSGHRLLFFSQFTGVLKLFIPWLEENGIRYEYLDGSTQNRQERVDRFNADSTIPVFLLSLKAGGTGLNLTGADTVIHYDQWWNPMVEDQATDRTHRIGQTRTVTAMKLVARHTVEEKVLALQESKRDLFNKLINGAPGRIGELTEEDMEFLLSKGQ